MNGSVMMQGGMPSGSWERSLPALCSRYLPPARPPQKYRGLMNFLSNVLREDGGFEYKKAIVDAILVLIRDIPEAKESGLAQLCEFIEDCEFTFLSVQILHLLGEEGPATKDPGGVGWLWVGNTHNGERFC